MIRCNNCKGIIEDNSKVCQFCKEEIDINKAVVIEKNDNKNAIIGFIFSIITPPIYMFLNMFVFYKNQDRITYFLGEKLVFKVPLIIVIVLLIISFFGFIVSIISLIESKKCYKNRLLFSLLGIALSLASVGFIYTMGNFYKEENDLCPKCEYDITGTPKP
jgi:RNA polymerase subunit RPABC4/transcription elongation factor Spt4